MRKFVFVPLLTLGLAAAATTVASAATDTYMLVPGIAGGSLDVRHANWIDVLSLSQGWSGVKKTNSCDVSIVKDLDIAGPKLWGAAVTGQALGEVRIEVFHSGGEPTKLYEIRLTNARILNIATSGSSGGGSFVESLTLTSDTATLSYYQQRPDGSIGAPITSTIACN